MTKAKDLKPGAFFAHGPHASEPVFINLGMTADEIRKRLDFGFPADAPVVLLLTAKGCELYHETPSRDTFERKAKISS